MYRLHLYFLRTNTKKNPNTCIFTYNVQNPQVLTLSNYRFDVFENMEFISLGSYSPTAKLLNRCSPRKSLLCNVSKGKLITNSILIH